MAAPQWSGGKCKSVQQAKAFFRHNDADRRKETNHTNPHIDKSKTPLNFSYRGLTYEQRCEAYDKRMGEIDQGRPSMGKNARTVLQSVILYPPAALQDDKDRLKAWFMRAGEVAEARFGANLIDMAVDMDEVHEYTDKDGQKRVSLEHGHLWLVPAVDGKLNGKQFSSRAVITGFNNELQAMSEAEFGCPMMDGSRQKGGETVEAMKTRSERKALEARERAVEAQEARTREIMAEAVKARQEAVEALQRAETEAKGLLARTQAEAVKLRQGDAYRAYLEKRVPDLKEIDRDFLAGVYGTLRQAPADPQPQRSRGKARTKPKAPRQSEAAARPQPKPAEQPPELSAAQQARIRQTLADLGYDEQGGKGDKEYGD